MCRSGDEIDLAITQGAVGAIDRKDQFDLDVQSFATEAAEFGRRQRRKVGVRDQIRYREFHAGCLSQMLVWLFMADTTTDTFVSSLVFSPPS